MSATIVAQFERFPFVDHGQMPQIRPMTREELTQQVEWAKAEGWEPGRDDAELFWHLDPEGFLALEQDGKFIGGGAIIRHSSRFGFMGLFIVDREYRGQGFGTELWFARRDQLISRLDDGATIGLDGVYEMVPFYEQGGFRQYSYYRRFLLPARAEDHPDRPEILDLANVEPDQVAAFDRKCFPADRAAFLEQWIRQPTATSRAFVENGELRGFGVLRPGVTGWRLAPLFADSREVAEALLQSFASQQGDRPLFLDVPDDNPAARDLRTKYEMEEVFGCVRMYLGPVPETRTDMVFGVTTFEVG